MLPALVYHPRIESEACSKTSQLNRCFEPMLFLVRRFFNNTYSNTARESFLLTSSHWRLGDWSPFSRPSLVLWGGYPIPTSEGTNDFIDYLVWPRNADWWNPQGRRSAKAYFTALWNHFQTKPAREGIAVVDGLVATNLEQLLNNGIYSLIEKQQNERTVD